MTIEKARKLAAFIRFPRDIFVEADRSFPEKNVNSITDNFYRHGVFIDKNIAPDLYQIINNVCEKLFIPKNAVLPFVNASSELQASCISISPNKCILTFSSSLINLLDLEEFYFVVGHELGHFIFQHLASGVEEKGADFFILRRAQEISVDRTGLIACGDINTASRALIKTASGLGNKHLKFDINQYISQTNLISNPNSGEGFNATHPSMLLRCRALLWFSMQENFVKSYIDQKFEDISSINKKIEKDLDSFVEGNIDLFKDQLRDDLAIWVAVKHVSRDGKFDNAEQKKFSEVFGEDILEKVKNFLATLTQENFLQEVDDKLEQARTKYKRSFPLSFDVDLKKLEEKTVAFFS